ncbi:MAG: LysM peptidoglycan-binding domain-containing protein [Pirellulales bacterium]
MSNKNHEKMDGSFDHPQAEKLPANTGKPARPPKPKGSLGRETKVGLGVIGALLVIFVIVLVVRLRGDGDDDVAKNGTSAAEDDGREKSGAAEKKASPSKDRTEITAQTVRGPLPPYLPNTLRANADTLDANSGYGSIDKKQDQATVQDRTQYGYPTPNGANSAANSDPSGGIPAAGRVDQTLVNPFNPRPGTKGSLFPQDNDPSLDSQNALKSGLTATENAVDQPAANESTYNDRGATTGYPGLGGSFPARQASGTPSSEGADALKNVEPSDDADSSVRIVTDNGTNANEDRNFADTSSDLTPVDDFPPQPGSIQAATSKTAGRDNAEPTKRAQFRDPRMTVDQTARKEDVKANDDSPPAPLKADSAPGDELYVVNAKDSYWDIAQKAYGSGAYFKALYEYNRRAGQGAVIRAGAQLRLPDEATLQRLYPTLCPPPQRLAASSPARRASANVEADDGDYEVQDGDTLYEIARRQLGQGSRFAEVYELNRELIGRPTDRLQPGMRLRLPGEP